ncbi:MAG: hypothetical protein ACXAD7_16045 [Candidatus Kariarchaeaceae archaeon]|jgi:hypothetical protein
MADEVIMYQSMFLLGVLMFGFFAVSFDNYEERANDVLQETSFEQINENIGRLIINLIDTGQGMKELANRRIGNSFNLTIPLSMESVVAEKNYQLWFGVINTNGIDIGVLNITTSSSNSPISSYNLGFENSTSLVFDGSTALYSNSASPEIYYSWDGTREIISFN